MPGYRRGFSRRRGALSLNVINSIKHVVSQTAPLTSTNLVQNIAKAVNSPSNTVVDDVRHGAVIKAIHLSLDICGLAASGALQRIGVYIIKNPGANLTPPGAFAVGSSNEKKFVIKQWHVMTMRNQDGNPPYHWEGWLKIPKRYHRMGTDDIWQIVWATNTSTGHGTFQAIYKEYF